MRSPWDASWLEAGRDPETEQPVGRIGGQAAVEAQVELSVVRDQIFDAAAEARRGAGPVKVGGHVDGFAVGAPFRRGYRVAERDRERPRAVAAVAGRAVQIAGDRAGPPAVRQVPLGHGVELIN